MAGKKQRKVPDPDIIDRELAVVELRRTGETWDRIAKVVGYANAAGAYKAYKRALLRTLQQPTEEMRDLELDRLDRLQRAYWKRAIDGETRAADFILRVIDRRAKILGLDAPQKIQAEVVNYDGSSNIDPDIERIIRLLDQVDQSRPLQVESGISESGTTTTGE